VPFGVFWGHVLCNQGLLVDPTNIAVILDLQTPTSVRQLREAMDFIRGYAQITSPMEKLLKKEAKFQWNEDCRKGLDTLKKKLVSAPILIFPYWKKEFQVHVDASSIALGTVLSQPSNYICK
jgi:hypothetical protein